MIQINGPTKKILGFKVPFNNSEKLHRNYSQASQDVFAAVVTNGKLNGTFLDLGCNKPTEINNTFMLEEQLGWKGLSLDIDPECVGQFSGVRKNPALVRDCTKLDWNEILGYYESSEIDYLSLDLEPAAITLECLQNIPFDRVSFSVITFEHDFYRFGNHCRLTSRDIFQKNGYLLLASDIKNHNCVYEDWYVNPKTVDLTRIKLLQGTNIDWQDLLYVTQGISVGWQNFIYNPV
jgi:hypothetical protein